MSTLWIRDEIKPFEKRAPITPFHVGKLIEESHEIIVESSANRIFPDADYLAFGCKIAQSGSWPSAPKDAIILGLKYLKDVSFPLIHRHIYFAHAYNDSRIFHEKSGVTSLMQNFRNGGGTHYDLEFLTDNNFQRVAAFGVSAGFAGASIALLILAKKMQNITPPFTISTFYDSSAKLLQDVQLAIEPILLHQSPKILIIGATGRCGRGAKNVLEKFGLTWDEWGQQETQSKDKLLEIMTYDLLINCAGIKKQTQAFLTNSQLYEGMRLNLIADIGCETSGNNPLPIYNGVTTYDNPTHRIALNNQYLDIIAIDNLPTFLPFDSSTDFSTQLFPHLRELLNCGDTAVWDRAGQIFQHRLVELA